MHPQFWTDDIEYANQNVVIIGSGATAVTLVPEMAEEAKHVTMLQRSPTYVVSIPSEDRFANRLRRHLPEKLAYAIARWRNVLLQQLFFNVARRWPKRVRKLLMDGVRKLVGPDYDVDTHFNPTYDPWDQRLCFVPDADLFDAIREERASVVTDHIETFTETGIRLQSGRELSADLIVTATGLDLQFLGGIELSVDGRRVDLAQAMTYKGMMFSDVPNLANSIGYTNASWTLKCDLTCEYVCRLLNPHGGEGLRPVHAATDGPGRRRAAVGGLHVGLRPALAAQVPEEWLEDAVATEPELRPRRGRAALRPARGRRDGVPGRRGSGPGRRGLPAAGSGPGERVGGLSRAAGQTPPTPAHGAAPRMHQAQLSVSPSERHAASWSSLCRSGGAQSRPPACR